MKTFLAKEGMEMSEASRGTSGTQVLHRPEVLQTPSLLVLECLFSKPEAVLTAPVRNITLNIHALFLFVAFFFPRPFKVGDFF